jgi:HK97 family phage major capsid protein
VTDAKAIPPRAVAFPHEGTFKDGKIAIEREEKVEAIKASLAKPLDVPAPTDQDPAQPKFRYGTLKAFKSRGRCLSSRACSSARPIFNDQKALEWCREHGVPVIRAQGETVGTTGGYLVPTQLNQAIIDLRETYGTFRQAVRPIPMGSDSMTMPRRAGGLTATSPAENGRSPNPASPGAR